ncbi:hypothetical protein [Streptomyces aureus]|uniref:hypothetical protein n=1 Tax=Streptomyces aureus TaxID=193461 RepID=UPI000AE4BE6C|nr:hypothetical protein [Streptomyces aureus]
MAPSPPATACGDVLTPGSIHKADLKASQYWISSGPKTARQIDTQLHCKKSK